VSASASDSSAPSPARTPPPAQRAGLRQRLRALRVHLRQRGRVELRGRPLLGRGLRFEVAPGAHVIVGDGASLGERCRLHVHAGTVTIGEGAVLGERCSISARTGVHIGERCVLGDEVAITDFSQRFDDVENPIRLQEPVSSPVRIEEGAVLGPRAAVLPGVRVGAGARVGAHSVLTCDVAAGAAVEGTPARPVGSHVPERGSVCGLDGQTGRRRIELG
jgi:acetyltransferase-like isoleucine patch superfamily enzyme